MPHYEYDKDYPFAAFITNRGKYNEGSLVGEWVKFPTTAEEMQKLFERIGIGSKDDFGQPYEEWFITVMWTTSMTNWASTRTWTATMCTPTSATMTTWGGITLRSWTPFRCRNT